MVGAGRGQAFRSAPTIYFLTRRATASSACLACQPRQDKMPFPNRVRVLLTVVVCLASANAVEVADGAGWAIADCPYRVRLRLDAPLVGSAVLRPRMTELLEQLSAVSVDQLTEESFAFEKAVLVDPRNGHAVGRFKLIRAGEPLMIDGSFTGLRSGSSPWQGAPPEQMEIKTVQIDGAERTALLLESDQVRNAKLTQPVELTPGERYLLDYWIMMDPQENELSVMINDPRRALFAELPHSYVSRMPPRGQWEHRWVQFVAPAETSPSAGAESVACHLDVNYSFAGRGGIAEMRLQPVQWRLFVESDEPVETLDLYAMARAGHRLTVPQEDRIAAPDGRAERDASWSQPESQPLNRSSALATNGTATAWTVDPVLPLKVGRVRDYQPTPEAASRAAQVTAFFGGSASLVVVIDAGKPRLDDLKVATDLHAPVQVHRLATIPVYDGPTVEGEPAGDLIERRYEAMTPLDFALDPDSGDGVHVLLVTFTPDETTPSGEQQGEIALSFAGQTLVVPVALRVAPLTLAPPRHFAAIFGSISFLVSYPGEAAGMVAESVSQAAFHGLDDAGLSPETIMSLSIPDAPDERTAPVRRLAERYFDVLLDNHLLPQTPTLYAYYSYEVREQGEDRAPELVNWDFSGGFDRAVQDFVIGRDMPWLQVGRSNGALIRRIELANGKTYSLDARPGDSRWVQLPRDEFYRLVGEYWDRVGRHLETLGVLDRALYVIDESLIHTYDDIQAYVQAMQQRPYARRIKIGHTIQHTTVWTRQLDDGALLMDDLLDVPMAINDDHYNFFEPEWESRFDRPKTTWVYNVETDHFSLENAGLSTAFLPLKLRKHGVEGWYCWENATWSLPYPYEKGAMGGFKYVFGPVINPWINPFYHHGPGALSFFYPPDPRGLANEPTDLVIPSYRLTLLREGIQLRALLEALAAARDDEGAALQVDFDRLRQVEQRLSLLNADNPVQWYLSYGAYQDARDALCDLAFASGSQ